MIHFDPILKLWQFDVPPHNVNRDKGRKIIYNQLIEAHLENQSTWDEPLNINNNI